MASGWVPDLARDAFSQQHRESVHYPDLFWVHIIGTILHRRRQRAHDGAIRVELALESLGNHVLRPLRRIFGRREGTGRISATST